jgi:large subunit ribosomal protein L10
MEVNALPNQKVLSEKQAIVEALKRRITEAQSGVLVDYKGINVANDTALRRKLRDAGVEYTVIKNTLMNFAVQDTGLADLASVLSGTTALATSMTDMVAPARVLKEYADKSNGAFTIKAGFSKAALSMQKAFHSLPICPAVNSWSRLFWQDSTHPLPVLSMYSTVTFAAWLWR